jgi:hypothetical protein
MLLLKMLYTDLLLKNIGKTPPSAAASQLSLFQGNAARQLMLANNALIFQVD